MLDELRDERKDTGKQLGSFCDQYGFQKTDVASSIKRKQQEKREISHKSKPLKSYVKYKRNKTNTSKPYKRKSEDNNKKSIVCYQCGKVSHYAKNCRVKQKI